MVSVCVYLTYTIINDNDKNVNTFPHFLQFFAVKNNVVSVQKFI
nr:MAG TPA_asm: hypothetical protein [Bacteriophage sp.]